LRLIFLRAAIAEKIFPLAWTTALIVDFAMHNSTNSNLKKNLKKQLPAQNAKLRTLLPPAAKALGLEKPL
jgi:hypothetical protein